MKHYLFVTYIVCVIITSKFSNGYTKKDNINNQQFEICNIYPKQSLQNILNIRDGYPSYFKNEYNDTGAMVLENYKMLICTIPKAGCSEMKNVIAKIINKKLQM